MSNTTLTPIETVYRGYRFRSRLEARWAVFLTAAGIQWQYEAEGYRLDGIYYLPDFWLPRARIFLEIKPKWPPGGYNPAIKQIAPLTRLADASGCEVYLIAGSPSVNCDDGLEFCETHPSIIGFAPDKGICSARLFECPFCGTVSIRRFAGSAWDAQSPCRPGVIFADTNYNPYEWSARIQHAMQQARGARFEHGEHG